MLLSLSLRFLSNPTLICSRYDYQDLEVHTLQIHVHTVARKVQQCPVILVEYMNSALKKKHLTEVSKTADGHTDARAHRRMCTDARAHTHTHTHTHRGTRVA